jgi:hypothetical protein
MSKDQSILKRIHPSDRFYGSSRRDQIGGPSVNPLTGDVYPVKDKTLKTIPSKDKALGNYPTVKPSKDTPLFNLSELKRINKEKEAILREKREREEEREA